jgi:hypothetical protein
LGRFGHVGRSYEGDLRLDPLYLGAQLSPAPAQPGLSVCVGVERHVVGRVPECFG